MNEIINYESSHKRYDSFETFEKKLAKDITKYMVNRLVLSQSEKGEFTPSHDSLGNSLHPGDILVVDRILYKHYAIYAGDGKVIHFAGEGGDFMNPVIHEAPFSEFLSNSSWFCVLPSSQIQCMLKKRSGDCHIYSPEETVQRAREACKEGRGKYNLAFNNCEHFALWCKTGVHMSEQVEEVAENILQWILEQLG